MNTAYYEGLNVNINYLMNLIVFKGKSYKQNLYDIPL